MGIKNKKFDYSLQYRFVDLDAGVGFPGEFVLMLWGSLPAAHFVFWGGFASAENIVLFKEVLVRGFDFKG